MQLKTTEDPQPGALPPGVAEEPPAPRHGLHTAPRGHPTLRHRCPLGCTRTHSPTHPANTQPPQGTPHAHQHHQTLPAATPFVNTSNHHNLHHQNPYYPTASPPQPQQQQQYSFQPQQQAVTTSSNVVSKGVSEWRVPPPLSHQPVAITYFPQPLIPVDFRRRAIQYMSKRLQVGVDIEAQTVTEVENRILTLEEQVYNSSVSQDEYITKLASRLAAILQHIDNRCRAPHAPATLPTQQEPVM